MNTQTIGTNGQYVVVPTPGPSPAQIKSIAVLAAMLIAAESHATSGRYGRSRRDNNERCASYKTLLGTIQAACIVANCSYADVIETRNDLAALTGKAAVAQPLPDLC